MIRRPVQAAIALAFIMGVVAPASGCRLPHRLLIERPLVVNRPLMLLSVSAQQTTFDLSSISGNYTQFTSRLELRGTGGFLVGGELPLVAMRRHDRDATKFGAGNPVLFGQRQWTVGANNEVRLGLQIEIPVGDHDAGLASDHLEFLPHGVFTRSAGRLGFSTGIGLRLSTGSNDHHEDDETVLLVDPHADSEFLYRVSLSGYRPVLGVTPSAYWDGQIAIARGSDQNSSATAGLVVSLPINATHLLVPEIEFPVVGAHRMNWTLRLSAEARI